MYQKLVQWDLVLVANCGQHLVKRKASGEHIWCIGCAMASLNCYLHICFTNMLSRLAVICTMAKSCNMHQHFLLQVTNTI